MALVRKELVRPDRTQLPGDDAFRFRHLLIRDAAYDGLPKSARAELHERFAAWLELLGKDLIELDEILGYHLEQAHRYRAELGVAGDETDELARRAADRLAAAGERALSREDVGAAITLIERALVLFATEDRPLKLEVSLVGARSHSGDLAGALAAADELAARARRERDRPRELRALVARARVAHLAESANAADERPLVEEALEVFQAAGDDAGLAETWALACLVELSALQWRAMALAADRSVEHAERAGDRALLQGAMLNRLPPRVYGPFQVDEALAFMRSNPVRTPHYASMCGQLEAMRGNFDEARRLIAEGRERARELGQGLMEAGISMQETEVELQAGDAEAAAAAGLKGVAELAVLGEQGWLSTVAGHTAEALYRLGRDDEAWHLTETAAEAGAADDVITQMLILQVRAKILARRGEHAEAERLAREAIAWGEPTDGLDVKANSYLDLAIVLAAPGKRDDALDALVQAQTLYDQKGQTVGVARLEELRSELGASLEA
jgi:tetratricopeptide (TPR) repeat protein